MDMETGQKEARLLSQEDENEGGSIVIFDNTKEDLQDEKQRSPETPTPRPSLKRKIINKEFGTEIDQLSDRFISGEIDLNELESLAELSHEIDHGSRIAALIAFELLNVIRDNGKPFEHREVCARIFGAAFRNNPEALKQLEASIPIVVRSILSTLESEPNEKLQARLIYILSSLMSHQPHGINEFKATDGSTVLRNLYSRSNSGVKNKCSAFVNDFIADDDDNHNNHYNADEAHGIDHIEWRKRELAKWSDTFQGDLATSGNNNDDSFGSSLPVFNLLIQIHKKHRDLPVKQDFLEWLSHKSELQKEILKNQQLGEKLSYQEKEFLTAIFEVRHEVFGNPKASRKHLVDDL